MAISTSDLTSDIATTTDGNYTVTGNGVFDDLMEAINTHLTAQFKLGRLTGADYANVYLGAVQSSLQTATEFALRKALTDAQVITEGTKNTLTINQSAEVIASTTRQDIESTAKVSLMADQELEVVASTIRQNNDSAAKISLMGDQEAEVVASTVRQDAESTTKISLMAKQELEVVASTVRQNDIATVQVSDTVAATDLKVNQSAEVLAATARQDADSVAKISLMADQEIEVVASTARQDDIAAVQVSSERHKILDTVSATDLKEQQILDLKLKNGEAVYLYVWEVAYTADATETYTYSTIVNLTDNDVVALMNANPHIPDGVIASVSLNNTTLIAEASTSVAQITIEKAQKEVDVLNQKAITEFAQTQVTSKVAPHGSSIMGRQGALYAEQAKGFKWNADQKYIKTLLDAWSINTNSAGAPDPTVTEISGTSMDAKIVAAKPST